MPNNNRFSEYTVDSTLVLLNDGSVTRNPDTAHHRASAISLSFSPPTTATRYEWEAVKESVGRDHLPINILPRHNSDQEDSPKDTIPKYNYTKAEWIYFQNILRDLDTENMKRLSRLGIIVSKGGEETMITTTTTTTTTTATTTTTTTTKAPTTHQVIPDREPYLGISGNICEE